MNVSAWVLQIAVSQHNGYLGTCVIAHTTIFFIIIKLVQEPTYTVHIFRFGQTVTMMYKQMEIIHQSFQ